MKLLQKQLTKEGPGWVKLVPEEGEPGDHGRDLALPPLVTPPLGARLLWAQDLVVHGWHVLHCRGCSLWLRPQCRCRQWAPAHACMMGTSFLSAVHEVDSCLDPNNAPPPPMPRSGEDLWHAYNLVREGDRVEATTFRKVRAASTLCH